MGTNRIRRTTRIQLIVGAVAVTAFGVIGSTATAGANTQLDPLAASPTTTAVADPRQQHDEVVDAWLDLWNGDYAQAERVIAPDLQVHAPMLDGGDGSAVQGPVGLVEWITQTRTTAPDLRFTVEVGPLVDGDHVALRWIAEGTYAGTVPGAAAPAGTPISFTGTDLLRIEDGQVAEYWLNADTLGLLTQLEVQTG